MTAKTVLLLGNEPLVWHPMYGFVFCATWFIYALHRVVGLQKSKEFTDKGRYRVIQKYKSHIIIYSILGAVGSAIFGLMLSWKTILIMCIPALFSLWYVIPILLGNKKMRLRDFNFVKIFFVALVWSWVSVVLPFLELNNDDYFQLLLMFLEVFLFVFSITIPFDIRDLKIDRHNEVRTIPSIIGVPNSIFLSMSLLLISVLVGLFNFVRLGFIFLDNIPLYVLYLSGVFITFVLIVFSSKIKHDYYFTGLIDGLMILIPVLIYLGIII